MDKTLHEYLAAKLKLQNTKQKKRSRWKKEEENKIFLKTPVGQVPTFNPPLAISS